MARIIGESHHEAIVIWLYIYVGPVNWTLDIPIDLFSRY